MEEKNPIFFLKPEIFVLENLNAWKLWRQLDTNGHAK